MAVVFDDFFRESKLAFAAILYGIAPREASGNAPKRY